MEDASRQSGPCVDGTKLARGRPKPANKPLERYRLDGVGRKRGTTPTQNVEPIVMTSEHVRMGAVWSGI